MTARQITALKTAYQNGETIMKMEERTGISKGALSELLRALGCKMRPKGRAKKTDGIKSK